MDRDDRLDAPVKGVRLELIFQINPESVPSPSRDSESDPAGKLICFKMESTALSKKQNFLNVKPDVPIMHDAVKVFLIIDKIVGDAIKHILKNPDVLVLDISPGAHIKASHTQTGCGIFPGIQL